MSSGKQRTPYPVGRPFTPPADHLPRKPHWAGLLALAAVVAFLCTGLILLINCLQAEADAPKAESRPEVAQISKDVHDVVQPEQGGGPVTGAIREKEETALPSVPKQQVVRSQEPELLKNPAQRLIGHDLGAPLKDPRPRPPDVNPLLKLDQPKPPPAIPPSVPRPRTPDSPKSYISGLPRLLPNEKSFILGPLDVPRAGTLKFSTIAVETDPKPMRLAISPPQYDDMGQLLTKLGEGYRYTQLQEADLGNLAKLKQFNVLFLT